MASGMDKGGGLQLRLLGEMALFRKGRALTLPPSKKTRALLAYLAATGKPQLREHLCELLWDGPDDPRAQLRWSLSKLRPLLDDGKVRRVRADRDRIALDVQDLEIDLDRIRTATRQGLSELTTPVLAQLANRFSGGFLDGLELSSCYRFHAWCVALREQLHSEHVTTLTTLIERLRASATPEQALHHARALVALDPLAESSHIGVVRLLTELGRPREALDQYERWRQLLAHELGGKPSREMEAVRMAIGKLAAANAEAAPELATRSLLVTLPSAGKSRVPLIGRAVELSELAQRFHATRDGRGREVVLLVGDPGMGKSRMLEELAAFARQGGGQVLYGRAFEAELIRPYGAWIDALRSGGHDTAFARDTLPLLAEGESASAQVGESRPNPIFERVTQFLRRLTKNGGPALVLLDDIQWLDEASAALLHFVARALENQPILLALAGREGELSDNSGVLRLVRALEREHRLHQVPLRPLGPSAIAALVATVSHDVAAGAVHEMREIVDGCEGNPLFALEMARGREAGEKGVPQSLRALIGERLDRLDEPARVLLPVAAAIGRAFDPRILASVQGMPLLELSFALEALERRGILRALGSGAYDFSHDLIRQAAYHQLSEPRRRLVHLQLARVLSGWPDPDGDLTSDLAHHAAIGGDSETAAHAYLAAAQRCVRLYAWGEASDLCRHGIEQLPRLDRAKRLRLHIELLGVEVMGKPSMVRTREIERELLCALTAAEEAGLHKDAARGYYLHSVVQFRTENLGAAAETSWRAVQAGRSADDRTAARSQAETGRCLVLLERDIGKAKELLEGARAVLLDGEDLILSWGLGLLKRYTGESEEAARCLRRAAESARRISSHWEETECLRALTMLAIEQRDFASARALCPRLLDLAERMGEGSERPIAQAFDDLARLLDGDATADAALESSLRRIRDADAKAILSIVLNVAADHDLTVGLFARAEARAAEALAAAQLVERRNQAALARATLARLAIRATDRERAQAHLAPLRLELAIPYALSKHARDAVERALREFEGLPSRQSQPEATSSPPALFRGA